MLDKVRELSGQEKQLFNALKAKQADKEVLDSLKAENKDRATKGLNMVFKKKRDIKELYHK